MDSTNVIIGSGALYVAPIGTALPALDGTYPIVWVDWVQVGYTDDGVEFQYSPTYKDIMVDEEMAAVKKILTGEKCTFSAKLAEATLANLNYAIAASSLTHTATVVGPPAKKAYDTLKFGSSQADNIVMVGFEGPASGTNLTRVIIGYKAKSMAQIGLKYQRTDKIVIPVEFDLLVDSTKPAGQRLGEIVDIEVA